MSQERTVIIKKEETFFVFLTVKSVFMRGLKSAHADAKIERKRRGRLPRIEVVDLFCGIGGLSYGMKSRGLHILEGFDLDWTCQYAYEANTDATFIYKDVRKVTGKEIRSKYNKNAIKVLAGCAPCQPFSSYAFKNKHKDPNKYDLLYEFGRLVKEVQPDIVTMENVPSIASFK